MHKKQTKLVIERWKKLVMGTLTTGTQQYINPFYPVGMYERDDFFI